MSTTITRLLGVPVVSALFLASCGIGTASSSVPLRVVAGESPWGAVAAAIGGNRVNVVSLLANPALDPHSFTATAADAALVNQASVVIENGMGYDPYVGQLLATGATGPRRVVNVSSVLKVVRSDANPHLWYWIDHVPIAAAAIEQAMAAQDPRNRSYFLARLKNFTMGIATLVKELATIKLERHGCTVAQTERVAAYLLTEAGLRIVSPLGFSLAIENGVAPSFSDQRTIQTQLKDRRVAVLVYNVQTVSGVTTQVQQSAQNASIPVLGVSEVVEPEGASFVSWQHAQITRLSAALGVHQ